MRKVKLQSDEKDEVCRIWSRERLHLWLKAGWKPQLPAIVVGCKNYGFYCLLTKTNCLKYIWAISRSQFLPEKVLAIWTSLAAIYFSQNSLTSISSHALPEAFSEQSLSKVTLCFLLVRMMHVYMNEGWRRGWKLHPYKIQI